MRTLDQTTRLVVDLRRGDPKAAEVLLPIVYEELRALAASYFASQPRSHTLSPTVLVHEAYLKLVDQTAVDVADRVHFFRLAAKAMRQVLIDHARASRAIKRGGNQRPMSLLEDPEDDAATSRLDLLALDEALDVLSQLDERQAAVVELRFFGGLSVEEAATVLEVSPRTVELDWRMARGWLSRTLSDGEHSGNS